MINRMKFSKQIAFSMRKGKQSNLSPANFSQLSLIMPWVFPRFLQPPGALASLKMFSLVQFWQYLLNLDSCK